MWTFTDFGFFSAVQHRDQPDHLLVRSRSRKDLENLQRRYPGLVTSPIVDTPVADYGYRVMVKKSDWGVIMSHVAQNIDYDNFKDAVGQRQGWQRAGVYHDVWAAGLKITTEDLPAKGSIIDFFG